VGFIHYILEWCSQVFCIQPLLFPHLFDFQLLGTPNWQI
jgi:hypothetical protein